MRTISWLLLFVITLFLAMTLMLTFMQPVFVQEVSARILFFKTRAFPVYFYVLAALVLGLVLGFFPMFFVFIRAKREASRRGRRISELEEALESAAKKSAAEEAVRGLAASATPDNSKNGF